MMDEDFNDVATADNDDNDDDNGDDNDKDVMSKRKIVAKLTHSFFDVFKYSRVFLWLIMNI